jgi:hypothetical protein
VHHMAYRTMLTCVVTTGRLWEPVAAATAAGVTPDTLLPDRVLRGDLVSWLSVVSGVAVVCRGVVI